MYIPVWDKRFSDRSTFHFWKRSTRVPFRVAKWKGILSHFCQWKPIVEKKNKIFYKTVDLSPGSSAHLPISAVKTFQVLLIAQQFFQFTPFFSWNLQLITFLSVGLPTNEMFLEL